MSNPLALVTGGSRGIGRAIAEGLAHNGYDLLLVARNAERLRETRDQLVATGISISTAAIDLRDPAAAKTILDACDRTPDIVINNAGTAPTAKFESTSDAILDEVLDLHLRLPFRLLRLVLPEMKQRGSGCIIQLGSSAALRGFAYTAAYTAAKHAMIGMTRALAAELSRSPIDVYAACPGFVDTDITRGAASAIAERGQTEGGQTEEGAALSAMGAMNKIGRMHSTKEIAEAVFDLVQNRPRGCILDLDAEPPIFVS